MKIVAQPIPLFSRAVRVCLDDGTPEFVCIVTPKGWRWRNAWIWMGLGRLDRDILRTLEAELVKCGYQVAEFERLDTDGFSFHRLPLNQTAEQLTLTTWPLLLIASSLALTIWSAL